MSYGYDMGVGPVDLVWGRVRSIVALARITGVTTTYIGTGLRYAASAVVSSTAATTLPTNNRFGALTTSGVYSYAAGFIMPAASIVASSLYGSGDTSANTPFALGFDSTNHILFEFGNVTALTGGTVTTNVYHTAVGVAAPSGTGTGYFDGKLSITGAATTAITQTTQQPQFGGFSTVAISQGYTASTIYYGAAWNRALTAGEALLLHQDPYCFLIYPEDDLFATLVGVAATPGTAVFAAGATLPMMGVG